MPLVDDVIGNSHAGLHKTHDFSKVGPRIAPPSSFTTRETSIPVWPKSTRLTLGPHAATLHLLSGTFMGPLRRLLMQEKGGTDMADHGKKDSQREQKKKAQLSPKEKRKLKKEKKQK